MNQERDKFLTEAMGYEYWEKLCGYVDPNNQTLDGIISGKAGINFSIWTGFGKLWEWAHIQPWFWKGVFGHLDNQIPELYVHPDRLADMVYQYLQKEQDNK